AGAPADPCGAAKVRAHVGHPADAAMRAAVARETGAKAIRWLTPDSAVTMDYRPDRLNVVLDKANVVRSARCG
ncbi:MAG: I78 family peptidase inhibitor, partial [Cypionkella sp.]